MSLTQAAEHSNVQAQFDAKSFTKDFTIDMSTVRSVDDLLDACLAVENQCNEQVNLLIAWYDSYHADLVCMECLVRRSAWLDLRLETLKENARVWRSQELHAVRNAGEAAIWVATNEFLSRMERAIK